MWLERDDGLGRDILWRVGLWCLPPLAVTALAALIAGPEAASPAHLRLGVLWLAVTMLLFAAAGALSHRRRAWEDGLWMGALLAFAFMVLKVAGEGGWGRLDALMTRFNFAAEAPAPTLQTILVRTLSLTAAGALLAVAAHDCAYRIREALEDFGFLDPRADDEAPAAMRPQASRAQARPRPDPGPRAQERAAPPPAPDPAALREASACAILGLRAGASKREIMRAYKTLMKRAHPDHGGSTEAAARLNGARDYLLGKAR